MKFQLRYMALLFLTGILFSCKKEPIEEPIPDEQPVFYANCMLGSEAVDITAGQDNFYMQSYSEVKNGVKYFTGQLSNANVSLEMGIFDGNIDGSFDFFSTALPDSLSFAANYGQTTVTYGKDSLSNSQYIDEIQWFVDGVFAGTNDIVIDEAGKYSVCASVTFFDGSQKNVCNDVIVGYKQHAHSTLRHYMSQEGVLQAWIEESNESIAMISWSIDGAIVSNEEKLVINVDQQIHTVMADVVFQNGTHRKKSILVDGALNGRFVDDFTMMEFQALSYNQDFNVFIGFKKDGKEYRSDLTQNLYSTVKIHEISYYGLNSSGNAVFRVLADIDCMLKEVSTGELIPFSSNTSFGIEVK